MPVQTEMPLQSESPAFFLKDVPIANPFILAPLAGLTNWPFRCLAKEAGAALTVSEMVSGTGLNYKSKATFQLMETDPQIERPFCVQLFGKNPEHLAQAARLAVEAGADIIDLNMGCPARKVINSGHGAALLKDLKLVREILRAMVGAVSVPVTVKTRPSFAPEVGGTIWDLLPILVEEGVAGVTLHGRTAKDGFSGEADWDVVARLVEESPIPVIGSGDVTTASEAMRRLRETGVAGVMIGRGAKGRPWLFGECVALWRGEASEPVSLMKVLATAERHAKLLFASVGPRAPFMLRTVLMWYTKGLRGATEFRSKLCQETDLEIQLALLRHCIERHITETNCELLPEQ